VIGGRVKTIFVDPVPDPLGFINTALAKGMVPGIMPRATCPLTGTLGGGFVPVPPFRYKVETPFAIAFHIIYLVNSLIETTISENHPITMSQQFQ